ncbi:MAG TPA: TA system VapC family ribonuclease toxin [Luteolibacter sp.]
MDLPDVNLWLALTDPNHSQHTAARHYWDELRADSIVFCRITMLGLLRLATSNAVMQGRPFTHREIWGIYQTYLAMPIVRILPEPAELDSTFSLLTEAPHFCHRLWTDTYLAAFAITSDCRLVSFDADFSRFPQLNFLHLQS